MKKLLLSLIALMAISMTANAQYVKLYKGETLVEQYSKDQVDKVEFSKTPVTTGTAKAKLDGTTEVDVTWVQLWENGPKFATMNVGATITDYASATDYTTANVGGLYAWGTPGKDGRINPWDSSVTTGTDDIATTLWGSNWKTPSQTDLDNLTSTANCEWTWCDGSTTQYVTGCTLAGYKVSGKTDTDYENNSIFLPAAGYFDCNGKTVYDAGSGGFYWSSTEDGSSYAYYLFFNSGNQGVICDVREYGFSVRAVLSENVIPVTAITLSKTEASIDAGNTETLSVSSVTPSDATDQTVTWSSDNTAVATVDASGVVTGVAAGTATITATAHDGSGVSASCTVTVTATHDAVQLWESGPYWATTNIGASTPEEYGYYFAWGYTEGCIRNSADNGWVLASNGTTVKWFTNGSFPDRSESAFQDAATANWGSGWRMPTMTDFDNLQSNCIIAYVTTGTTGIRFTGKGDYSGNSIFLPFAGLGSGSLSDYAGCRGCYWSSTQYNSSFANYLYIEDDYASVYDDGEKCYGYPVRPVRSSL